MDYNIQKEKSRKVYFWANVVWIMRVADSWDWWLLAGRGLATEMLIWHDHLTQHPSVWPSFPCKFVIGNMNSVRNTAFKSPMSRPVWRLPILESGQIYKGGEVGIVLIRWTVTSEQDIPRYSHSRYSSKRRVVSQQTRKLKSDISPTVSTEEVPDLPQSRRYNYRQQY